MAKILVIDDEPRILEYVARVLRKQGHDILLADNGLVGTELFHAHAPDLVITDVFMPLKDGLETVREMLAARPDTPIVAMSGGGRFSPGQDYLKCARGLGAVIAIDKPFAPDVLLDAVAVALGQGKS